MNISRGRALLTEIIKFSDKSIHLIKNKFIEFTRRGFSSNKMHWIYFGMLFSALLGGKIIAMKGPFDSISNESFIVAILFAIIGHLSSNRLSNDSRISIPLYISSIIIILLLLVSGFTGIHEWPNYYRNILGYITLAFISLCAGILSGDMKSPPWMGNLLFKQHILPQMKKNDFMFLHWDGEGIISIVEIDDVVMEWIESRKMVIINELTLDQFSPICFDERRGVITPGLEQLKEIYSIYPTLWENSMKTHLKLLEKGYKRICWLNLLQIIIPKSPSSLAQERKWMQTNSNVAKINETSRKFSWPLPESVQILEHSMLTKPLLNYCLSEKDRDAIQPIESEIVEQLFPKLESRSQAYGNILRSFTHLLVVLRQEMEITSGSTKKQCRISITELSQWFKSLNLQQELFPENGRETYFVNLEQWSSWVEKSLIQPATVFLRLHDLLSEEVTSDDSDHQGDLNSGIAGLINECTRRVIETASFRPKDNFDNDDYIVSSFISDAGGNRKIAMLVGIWKMLLLVSLLKKTEEVTI